MANAFSGEVTVMSETGPIVFFDGVCGLCNRSVDFFIRRDREARLKFAPLQGETAADHVSDADRESLGSIVFVDAGTRYRKSAAIVQILRQLGGIWRCVAGVLWVIPRPLRDLGYSIVAALRYRLFGRKDSCRMPTPEERGRLLP